MKKGSQKKLHNAFENKEHFVRLLGEPSGKFDYYVKFTPPPRTDELTARKYKQWDWKDHGKDPEPSNVGTAPATMFHPPTNVIHTESFKKRLIKSHVESEKIQILEKQMDRLTRFLLQKQ